MAYFAYHKVKILGMQYTRERSLEKKNNSGICCASTVLYAPLQYAAVS